MALASAATAQSGARIVITAEQSAELARKIRAEAEHVGFTIVEPPLSGEHGASAVVRVLSDDQVELTIGTETPELRPLARRPGEDASFALRVVEELRARLIELSLWTPAPSASVDAAPSAPPVASSAPSPAPVAPAPMVFGASPGPDAPDDASGDARLWLRGGAGVLAPTGGVGPSALAILGLSGQPFAEQWELSALALLPLIENEVQEPEGEAEVGVNAFVLELEHHAALSNTWFVSAGVGGGLLVLATRAEAQPPFAAHEDTLLAGIYYLHVGAMRRVAPWLRLRASLLGGVSAPRPVIRFDDRDVAAWGRAFGGLSLGAELGMPLGREDPR